MESNFTLIDMSYLDQVCTVVLGILIWYLVYRAHYIADLQRSWIKLLLDGRYGLYFSKLAALNLLNQLRMIIIVVTSLSQMIQLLMKWNLVYNIIYSIIFFKAMKHNMPQMLPLAIYIEQCKKKFKKKDCHQRNIF